jgi:predicted nucleic acid-binding protein
MKITAVDTSILLDILIPNQIFIENSLKKLVSATNDGLVIVCDLVYAELTSQFNSINDLNKFLLETHLKISTITQETLFCAGQLWSSYEEKKIKKYYCPSCGSNIKIKCDNCQCEIETPKRILNDFIIGAHATKQASGLLTRDRGFYRHYFKNLNIV